MDYGRLHRAVLLPQRCEFSQQIFLPSARWLLRINHAYCMESAGRGALRNLWVLRRRGRLLMDGVVGDGRVHAAGHTSLLAVTETVKKRPFAIHIPHILLRSVAVSPATQSL